jgi:hypothetical protein
VTVSGSFALDVFGGSGDNAFDLRVDPLVLPGGLYHIGLFGGDGNNTTSFELAEGTTILGTLDVAVDMGGGDDSLMLMTTDVLIAGNARINVHLGAGSDRMGWTNQDVTVSGTFAVDIFGDAGYEDITAKLQPVILPGGVYHVGIFGGDSNDTVSLELANAIVQGTLDVAVDLGAGDGSFTLMTTDVFITGAAKINVHLGAGSDRMGWTQNHDVTVAGSIALDVFGGSGDDVMEIRVDPLILAGGKYHLGLFGGDGNDTASVELADGTTVLGTLDVLADMGNGDDTFAGRLIASNVLGTGNIRFSVEGGHAHNLLSFTVASPSDQTTPVPLTNPLDVRLDGGPGDGTILIDYENVLLEAPQRVTESGGSGNDNLLLLLDNPNPGTASIPSAQSSFRLVGGGGNDLISVLINDPFGLLPSMNVTVDGRLGNDNISFLYEGLLNNAVKVLLDGGPGNDTIDTKFFIDSRSTGALDVREFGGTGNDYLTLDVFFVNPDGTMTGSGSGELASFFALLEGSPLDIEAFTPNVLVCNSG